MRRFYRIEASPDLFGGIQIIRHGGRLGTRGQSLPVLIAGIDEHRAKAAPDASLASAVRVYVLENRQ